MAVFGDQITKALIQREAGQICTTLRDTLVQAVSFNTWLNALQDGDLTGLGFSVTDVTTLRGAFADLAALSALTYGGSPPGTYPQPAATHDYSANAKMIIGPM